MTGRFKLRQQVLEPPKSGWLAAHWLKECSHQNSSEVQEKTCAEETKVQGGYKARRAEGG
jgi:hypothetical protein